MTDARYEVLREHHRRLLVIARAIVEEAEAVSTPEAPMSSVRPFRLRQLRREAVSGAPQPSSFATMSTS
jgi:hypothetical protein